MAETAAINIPKRGKYNNSSSSTSNNNGHSNSTRPPMTSTSTSSPFQGRSVSSDQNELSSRVPSSSSSSAAGSPGMSSLMGKNNKGKGKEVVREQRRASLLSSSISKSEHTVVNIGDPDGPPRLITCVKASQGFNWNQDIFLPSYACEHESSWDLEHRPDPAEDIFITEEEAERMFPR